MKTTFNKIITPIQPLRVTADNSEEVASTSHGEIARDMKKIAMASASFFHHSIANLPIDILRLITGFLAPFPSFLARNSLLIESSRAHPDLPKPKSDLLRFMSLPSKALDALRFPGGNNIGLINSQRWSKLLDVEIGNRLPHNSDGVPRLFAAKLNRLTLILSGRGSSNGQGEYIKHEALQNYLKEGGRFPRFKKLCLIGATAEQVNSLMENLAPTAREGEPQELELKYISVNDLLKLNQADKKWSMILMDLEIDGSCDLPTEGLGIFSTLKSLTMGFYALQGALGSFPVLTDLNIGSGKLPIEGLGYLPALKNLTVDHFIQPPGGVLGNFPLLENLTIYLGNGFPRGELGYLPALTNLTFKTFRSHIVYKMPEGWLNRLSALIRLTFEGDVPQLPVGGLGNLPVLQELTMDFLDNPHGVLGQFPVLKKLNLLGGLENNQRLLGDFSALTELMIDEPIQPSPAGLGSFPVLEKLTIRSINYLPGALGHFPALKVFTILQDLFQPRSSLGVFPELTELTIGQTVSFLPKEGLGYFPVLKKLKINECLRLNGGLGTFPALRDLTIDKFTGVLAVQLGHFPKLLNFSIRDIATVQGPGIGADTKISFTEADAIQWLGVSQPINIKLA